MPDPTEEREFWKKKLEEQLETTRQRAWDTGEVVETKPASPELPPKTKEE